VPNGTYSFTVNSPSGYTAIPGSGSFTISSTFSSEFGEPSAYVYVAFSAGGGGVPASFAGAGTPTPIAASAAGFLSPQARAGRTTGL
jgi:hypothetical protein